MKVVEPLVFDEADLSCFEVPVKLGKTLYNLREASGGVATKYRNATMRGMRVEDQKVVGMDGIADAEPLLVSLCLCKTDDKGATLFDRNGNPITVTLGFVQALPSRIQKALYAKVREISPGLDEKETKEALNKRLADTQKKLELLEKEGGESMEDAELKKQQSETTDTSSLQES